MTKTDFKKTLKHLYSTPKGTPSIVEVPELKYLMVDGKGLPSLRFETLNEGLCAQIMHIGPYGKPMDDSFDVLKKHVIEKGYKPATDSHDVYFNDIRRTAPEKLKTLIRITIKNKSF